jgi:histidinol-phosphate aminotransferase
MKPNLSRRDLASRFAGAAVMPILTEVALAQRAAVPGAAPPDTIWLNANENPEGPPKQALDAALKVLPTSGRYHYQEYQEFYELVARSEGMEKAQILIGSGSSEVLQAAIHAFTSPSKPLIQPAPTYESPAYVCEALRRKVIRVALQGSWSADVKKLAEEAERAGGGLIYLCNPNNPTGAITPKDEIHWLVSNLPTNTVLMVDEAYIHFSASPQMESALHYVRQGKDVVVTRSYSKIYGMAGLRAGAVYGCPDLIRAMEPFRNNVISIVAVRAVIGALGERDAILADRKARYNKIREDVCEWLRSKSIGYIPSHANFIMIDVGRDARAMQVQMLSRGVAVGRPFPPLDKMMRVSVGTAAEMDRFRRVFWDVYQS